MLKNKIANNQNYGFSSSYFLLGIFLVVLFFLVGLFWYNHSRIILGVNLPYQKVGGVKIKEIDQVLNKYFNSLGEVNVLVCGENQSFITNLKNLGVVFSKEGTKRKLVNVGHQGTLIDQIISQIKVLFLTQRVNPVIAINENKFRTLIKNNLPGLEISLQNATVKYSSIKKSFEVISSQPGQKVKINILLNDLQEIINQDQKETHNLQLKTETTQPKIKTENVIYLVYQANKIIKNPIIIIGGEKKFKVDEDLITQWITFPIIDSQPQLSFNRKKIENYLIKLSSEINQAPINAQVNFENGKVKVFHLARWGKEVDIQKSIFEIENGLEQQQKRIRLVINPIKPLIVNNQDIEKLGIKDLLAVGESSFSGSPLNRIHNIKIGASKVSGLLIKPNEEFSFNQILGGVTKENGYLPELVIKNHQVIPELGGGLCQVSTTVFRAAVRAGLIITERQPHAFPVVYYNPQGFDATVYNNSPDLKFVNNTPNYLLIQTKIKNNHLYVYLYGTNDDREVKVIGPKVIKNTLKIKNREGKLVGNPKGILKTVLTEEVWQNKKIIYQKKFWSIYHSPLVFGE
ncbi:MAG TPA: hypothetical protein ENL06_02005 [Candidatus Portnoybacteria bacterium]|nr:hypothetical protein [Candidatus Portnoybacteria bacterium]